jgi:molybdopterin-guanine dinucleotide biosynthesis protein A
VEAVVVSANRNLDLYRALGYPVVSDESEDFLGPLAGILAALRQITTPLVISVPCDLPFLPTDLTPRLRSTLGTARIAVARTERGVEHAVMLFRRELADDLDAFLGRGGRAVHKWQERHVPVYADFDETPCFLNVNSQDEFRMAEQLLVSRAHELHSSARSPS